MTTFLAGAFGGGGSRIAARVVDRACARAGGSLDGVPRRWVLRCCSGSRRCCHGHVYLSTDPVPLRLGRPRAGARHQSLPLRARPTCDLVPLRDGRHSTTNINRKHLRQDRLSARLADGVSCCFTRLSETDCTAVRVTMVVFEALTAWFLIVLLLAEYGLARPARVALRVASAGASGSSRAARHCDAIMIAVRGAGAPDAQAREAVRHWGGPWDSPCWPSFFPSSSFRRSGGAGGGTGGCPWPWRRRFARATCRTP